jgi:hypothetical protein
MNNAILAAAALVLSGLPFPAPRGVEATDKTRCDWGPLASVSPDGSQLVVTTQTRPETFKIRPEVQVFDAEGKRLASVKALKVGQDVRVYYILENGLNAKVQEVDAL